MPHPVSSFPDSGVAAAPLHAPDTAQCRPGEAGTCCHGQGEETPPSWFRIGLALAIAGQAMFLSLGLNNARLAGESPPYGGLTYGLLHGGLILSCLLVLGLLGGPLIRGTWRAAKAKQITVEALFSLSLGGAFAGSLIASISGQGSIYYEVVAVVLAVYSLGQQVTTRQRAKALAAAEDLSRNFARAQVRLADGTRHELPVDQIDPERHRVLVDPGGPITVDGIICSGASQVQTTSLTGETAPTVKRPGDHVAAGMYTLDGALEIAPDPPSERTIDRILATVQSARLGTTIAQLEADRLMRYFVPLVVGTSAATFIGWLLAPAVPWWEALFNAMAVLLVACPCALGLATPIAVWTGLHRLQTLGITARHGRILDVLARTDRIVFDKTGTLTEEQLQVADFVTAGLDADARAHLRRAVAVLEQNVPHPTARALAATDHAAAGAPLDVRNLHLMAGAGVTGEVAGRPIALGHGDWIPPTPELTAALAASPAAAHARQTVFVQQDGKTVGAFLLQEATREGILDTLETLGTQGISVDIMTGDRQADPAAFAPARLEGGLTPEAKADRIENLRKTHPHLLFVGDGLNDAAAMAHSPGSIALTHGADLTAATGDAVLPGHSLAALPSAIALGRKWRAQLQGNLRFAAIYNLVGMALAAAGMLHPVAAAVLMVGSSFFVSLRALHGVRTPDRSDA